MQQDKFYYKAKREGFRARSVYKLKELQKRYQLIKKGDAVLDLGCSPGSWLQAISSWVGDSGIVLGADISSVKLLDQQNTTVWKEDVNNPEFISKLKEFLRTKNLQHFKVVVSDMAQKTKGIPYVDQNISLGLSKRAFGITKEFLAPGGNFVCKIFQSKEAEQFLVKLRKSFALVKMM